MQLYPAKKNHIIQIQDIFLAAACSCSIQNASFHSLNLILKHLDANICLVFSTISSFAPTLPRKISLIILKRSTQNNFSISAAELAGAGPGSLVFLDDIAQSRWVVMAGYSTPLCLRLASVSSTAIVNISRLGRGGDSSTCCGS